MDARPNMHFVYPQVMLACRNVGLHSWEVLRLQVLTVSDESIRTQH